MKNTAAFILITIIWFFGNQSVAQLNKKPGFIINGTITGAADGSVVKLYDLDAQKVLDSAIINKEKFVLKGHVDGAAVCWLECKKEYATIMVENVPMSFTSPLKDMMLEHKAEAGKEQALISELDKKQYTYDKRYMSAYDSLENKKYINEADKKRLNDIYNAQQDTSMLIYINFGKRHANSYFGQDIIYRNRKSIPHDTLEKLYKSMSPVLKFNQKGTGLKLFLYSALAQKGKPMIDFEVKSIDGKPFKLSALKGNYIYLTFGSIGCGPCRMENKALAANYSRLSPYMSIVTFSLDRNLTDWKNMAKQDGIIWNNVSDLKGDGKVKTLYNVQAIPAAFLIDKQGIIVERYDGYTATLIDDVEKKAKGL